MKKNVNNCNEMRIRELFDEAGICEGESNLDSLKCISLITMIEDEFNIEIPIEFFHGSLLTDSKRVCEIIVTLQEEGRKR